MLTLFLKPCSVRNGLCASVATGHSFRHHVRSECGAAVRLEAVSAVQRSYVARTVGHENRKSELSSFSSFTTCNRRRHAIVGASTKTPETAESAFLKDFFETGARMTRASSNVMRSLVSPGDTVCDATVGRQPTAMDPDSKVTRFCI